MPFSVGGFEPDDATLAIINGLASVKDGGLEPVKFAAGTEGQIFLYTGGSWEKSAIPFAVHLESLSPAGDASVTSSALDAYDEYIVRFALTGSAALNLLMQINEDTGANYERFWIDATGNNFSSGQTSMYVGRTDAAYVAIGEIRIAGKTAAAASGKLGVVISTMSEDGATYAQGGSWTGGNDTQVSKITVAAQSGTITGTVEIFGRNRQ